jgi:hypothetical protein
MLCKAARWGSWTHFGEPEKYEMGELSDILECTLGKMFLYRYAAQIHFPNKEGVTFGLA